MDWIEQGKRVKEVENKARAAQLAQVKSTCRDLEDSKLIEQIEATKKEIEHLTHYRYHLSPEGPFLPTSVKPKDGNHFPDHAVFFRVTFKNTDYLAVEKLESMKAKYFAPPLNYFHIEIRVDGVYMNISTPRTRFLMKSNRSRRIEPKKVTKQEVYKWFEKITKE